MNRDMTPPALISNAALLILVMSCIPPSIGGLLIWAQPPATDQPEKSAATERPIEYWLEQLDSDQFSRRQAATRQLNRFGQVAVDPLVKVAQSGKLELTQRALGVLQQLALDQTPDDDSGAWAALQQLVSQGSGSASMGARAALDEIRRERQSQAHSRLAGSGIQIGFREFVIDSSAINTEVVWIDKKWNGDADVLRWLRWINRVDHVLIEGDAVRREVLEHVVRMPDLRTIVLREATIRDDIFQPLESLSRIDQLEFRYITLQPEHAEKLARLSIRVSLSLMGTNLPVSGAQSLREAFPGIKLTYKHGGFLGVQCSQLSPNCQIDRVTIGGAAAKAGLQAGDVVIKIDDAVIQSFDDLQIQIGSHYPGDEIAITYDRFGEIGTTKVQLGRLDSE